jgi:hypothetical protein
VASTHSADVPMSGLRKPTTEHVAIGDSAVGPDVVTASASEYQSLSAVTRGMLIVLADLAYGAEWGVLCNRELDGLQAEFGREERKIRSSAGRHAGPDWLAGQMAMWSCAIASSPTAGRLRSTRTWTRCGGGWPGPGRPSPAGSTLVVLAL